MTRGRVEMVGLVAIGILSLASCGRQTELTSKAGVGAAKSPADSGMGRTDANAPAMGGASSRSGGGPALTAHICEATVRVGANDPVLTDFEDAGAIDLGYSRDSDGLETIASGSSDSGGGGLVGSPGHASDHSLQVTGSPVDRWVAAEVWFVSLNATRQVAQACADATAFDGISFWVRGTPGPADLELATPNTLTVIQGGICTGSCRVHLQVQVSGEWTHVEAKWSDFSLDGVGGVSPDQIVGLSLSLQPAANDAGPVQLMLDDLAFIPRTASSGYLDAGVARTSNGRADAGAINSSAACPPTPPAPGSPCTPPWTPSSETWGVFAHCSWGGDPRTGYRARAICNGGTWQVTWQGWQPGPSALPAECPAAPPLDQPACDPSRDPAECWYRGTSCACSQCTLWNPITGCTASADQPFWSCTPPPNGCPADIPQAGAACETEGLHCSNDCSLDIVCDGGVWEWLNGYCPTCASPDTPIATPGGDRPIAELREGDLVYSVEHGAIVAVPVVRVKRTPVHGHHVLRVRLVSGETLEISAGHPTADGRTFGSLKAGERMDALHTVASVATVPYLHAATYDILPASSTGTYFAAGVEIGSTLFGGLGEDQRATHFEPACSADSRRGD